MHCSTDAWHTLCRRRTRRCVSSAGQSLADTPAAVVRHATLRRDSVQKLTTMVALTRQAMEPCAAQRVSFCCCARRDANHWARKQQYPSPPVMNCHDGFLAIPWALAERRSVAGVKAHQGAKSRRRFGSIQGSDTVPDYAACCASARRYSVRSRSYCNPQTDGTANGSAISCHFCSGTLLCCACPETEEMSILA